MSFCGLILVGTIATMVGSAFQATSLLAAAHSSQQDALITATLQSDNALYAGYVHRYMDGQDDPQRAAVRATLQTDFSEPSVTCKRRTEATR